MSISDTWFGGTKTSQKSLLSPEQAGLLAQLNSLNAQYLPKTYESLGKLAYDPKSTYEYNADGGLAALRAGVLNPARREAKLAMDDSMHTMGLHSSAAGNLRNTIRQNTEDEINKLTYQDMIQQQQLKQQAAEAARNSQITSLGQLMGNANAGLGVKAYENVGSKTPGVFDWAGASLNALFPAMGLAQQGLSLYNSSGGGGAGASGGAGATRVLGAAAAL